VAQSVRNSLLLGMEKNFLIEPTYKTPLSFGEIWILAVLSRLVDDTDADYFPYSIPLKNIETFANIDVSGASSALLRRGVKWTFGQNRTFETNLINSLEWIHGDEPRLLCSIHPKIRPFLACFLSVAKGLDTINDSFLNLGVPQRIFAILAFTMLKNQQTYFFELEKLKVFLGVSDKYTLFSNFKIKILEEARKRIEEEIGLLFDYDEVKKGKKVSAIRFRLHEISAQNLFEKEEKTIETAPSVSNVKNEQAVENSLPESLLLEQLKPIVCKKFGVTQKMLKKLLDEFSIETINQAVVLTEKAIENGKIKGSPAGFFVEATRQNYQAIGNFAVTQDFAEQKRQSEARQKAKELAKIEAKQQQERDAIKKQEFEQERDTILKELKRDEILRNTVIERIKYSLFYLSYDAEKTFEENLETPSFLAAVLNFVKMIKNEK
jgi:plasmid replication initiation protein